MSGFACASILTLVSCSHIIPPNSKNEAKERWSDVRAKLKYQLAVQTFTAGHPDEAEKNLQEALSLNPAAPDPYVLHSKILLERGETASASEALDEALRHGGDNAETDYLSGVISQRYGKFDDALAWYQRASQREPMSAPYVAAVAETYVALDRAADALALVQSRWTDFEGNATLRSLAGEIFMMLGRYEEAANAYRDASRIAPDDKRLQYQLGQALTLSESYEEGSAVLAAATTADQTAEPSALAALGRCRLAMNQAEDAKTVLKKAVDADPNNPRNWSLYARAAVASNDLLTARRAATRTLQIQENAENKILLGYVCWMQRDFPAAVAVLEPLYREAPKDVMALYILAQSYQGMGNSVSANGCARTALRADAQCEWAKRILENNGPPLSHGPTEERVEKNQRIERPPPERSGR